LRDGDLLLIDAGGEFDFYTADVTRTFPVGKSFSEAQGKAYNVVLAAQKTGIAMTRPGVSLTEIHREVSLTLIEGLLSLGLLKGKAEDILKSGQHRRFYPHSTSHWLGLDVHDAGLYLVNGKPRPLEAGMVFTIEPGFYAQASDGEVPSAFRDIGIRIEDDILVTEKGCEVLTQAAPKERDEIEKLRSLIP
jgi:Xaa-Pro aminopeptidase